MKSLPKVVRILLHKGNVDGANINKKILLRLDHIKVDGKLKTVPERAVDQSGFLTFRIWVAPAPSQNSLVAIFVRDLGLCAIVFLGGGGGILEEAAPDSEVR